MYKTINLIRSISPIKNFFFLSSFQRIVVGIIIILLSISTISNSVNAQSENLENKQRRKNLSSPERNLKINRPESKYKKIYAIENMAPLPFKTFPKKPIYKGEINQEIIDESQKVFEFSKNQVFTTFDLNKQKSKERKKNKKEMMDYNQAKNKKFFTYFKRLQKIRSQTAKYRGFHYDYTNFLENFQMISRR